MRLLRSYNKNTKKVSLNLRRGFPWWILLFLLIPIIIYLITLIPPINPQLPIINADKNLIVDVEEKTAEPQEPKKDCRAFFTGALLGGYFKDEHISKIFEVDNYSEYVGSGEYPDNSSAFPKAVATTFDGIAIDKGTRVIIYAEKDFKGKILLDKTGPVLINNGKYRNDARYSKCNTEDFPADLQAIFPQSVREWSNEDMHDWSNGSIKIICN